MGLKDFGQQTPINADLVGGGHKLGGDRPVTRTTSLDQCVISAILQGPVMNKHGHVDANRHKGT